MTTPLIIIALLISPLLIAWLLGKRTPYNKHVYGTLGLSIAFFFFALGHFIATEGMVEMLPPWVPYRLELVYLTGILELGIAISLLLPRYRVLVAKLAIIVFVLFFPANIYAAWHSVGLGGHTWGLVYLFIRLPLQILLIGWTYYFSVRLGENTFSN